MANLYRSADQVQFYSSIRPNYPPELFHFAASKVLSHHLAWDADMGSGQAAISLSSLFNSIIIIDSSLEQISHAPTNLSNIRFIITSPLLSLSDLHCLVAPLGSVNLITVITTLHWFDILAFFTQACSILRRPSGVLVVCCYDYCLVVDGGRVDEIYRRLDETMWTYIRKDINVLVEEGYERLEFPFEGLDGVQKGMGPVKRFVAEREMGVEGLIALTKTWAGNQKVREARVEVLTEELVDELKRACDEDGEEVKKVKFPLSLQIRRMGSS